jgi:hypothetical protein
MHVFWRGADQKAPFLISAARLNRTTFKPDPADVAELVDAQR